MKKSLIWLIVLLAPVATARGGDSEQTPDREPPRELTLALDGGVKLELLLIRPGSFVMGDNTGQNDEKPAHKIAITKPFYLGKYQVTQEQWKAVMGANPSYFKGARNPVDTVSWEDCQGFLTKVNEKFASRGLTFSLPSEAQCEYACRAGSTSEYSFGDDETKLAEYGWYCDNSENKTHPVGEKKPNAWGLYDMHGNVWEWCADHYDFDYYAHSPRNDPVGPCVGFSRALRSGSCNSFGSTCRAAQRHNDSSTDRNRYYGLRVMCVR